MDFDGGDAGGGGDAGAGGGAAVGGAAAALFDGGQGGGGDADPGAGGGASGEQGAGAGASEQGGQDPDWYARLNAQPGEGEKASNFDYVKAKGFKDLDGLVKSAREAERALHESGRVKVPGEGASAEEIATFHKAIGVPEDAKGYEFKLPENAGGLQLDTEFIGKLGELGIKEGLPKAGFETAVNAYIQDQVDKHLAAVSRLDQEAADKFKEWGANADRMKAEALAATRALGLSRDDIAAIQSSLGAGRVLDVLQKIGGGIAEDVLTTGGTGRFGITAAEAQAEIDAIKADPDKSAAVAKPGSAEQVRWNRLLEVVADEANRKPRGG